MTLKEYFKPIYEATTKALYDPSRKNTGIFITKFFIAGGSDLFFLPSGSVTADKVETQRKIYNDGSTFSPDKKASFNPLNRKGLSDFLFNSIPEAMLPGLMKTYGIPSSWKQDKRTLCDALVAQFSAFLKSNDDFADDIIAMEYERLLSGTETQQEGHIEPLYPGDIALPSQNQCRIHNVTAHDKCILHEWIIQNRGKREWHGRKLVFANCREVVPRAGSNCISVPDAYPGDYIKMTVSMDARRHEGKTICHWIMVNEKGDDCFPNSTLFDYTLDAQFVYVPKDVEE